MLIFKAYTRIPSHESRLGSIASLIRPCTLLVGEAHLDDVADAELGELVAPDRRDPARIVVGGVDGRVVVAELALFMDRQFAFQVLF